VGTHLYPTLTRPPRLDRAPHLPHPARAQLRNQLVLP
jgi:hypothetical protein